MPLVPASEKIAWLREFVADPDSATDSIDFFGRAVEIRFGEGLGKSTLVRVVDEVRGRRKSARAFVPEMAQPEYVPPPAKTSVAVFLSALMRQHGLRAVRLVENGIEATTEAGEKFFVKLK